MLSSSFGCACLGIFQYSPSLERSQLQPSDLFLHDQPIVASILAPRPATDNHIATIATISPASYYLKFIYARIMLAFAILGRTLIRIRSSHDYLPAIFLTAHTSPAPRPRQSS